MRVFAEGQARSAAKSIAARVRGALVGPSPDYVADKLEFGSSRIKRWFDKDWVAS